MHLLHSLSGELPWYTLLYQFTLSNYKQFYLAKERVLTVPFVFTKNYWSRNRNAVLIHRFHHSTTNILHLSLPVKFRRSREETTDNAWKTKAVNCIKKRQRRTCIRVQQHERKEAIFQARIFFKKYSKLTLVFRIINLKYVQWNFHTPASS